MKVTLPRMHDNQFAIASDPTRFKVISAGRRFGKGVMGIGEAFKRGIGKKQKCRWISPTYASDSYQAGWNMALNLAKQIPNVEVHYQRKEFSFAKLGGGFLQFRTAEEPDGLRGEGIDFVIFDEAAHIRGLKEIWEQSVRPSLMDRKGAAWFISTPKGWNDFAELYKRAETDKEWKSFTFPTNSNPHIATSEIDAMRRDMPLLVARQEIDAEFVQLAGSLFKRENIRIIDAEPEGIQWVRSWDLAFTEKTTSDYSCGARMGVMGNGTIVVADIVHARMEWPAVVRCIVNTAKMDGPSVTQGIEVVGAQVGMLQTLMSDPLMVNIPFKPITVTKDKVTRALPLVARAEQNRLVFVRGHWNKAALDEISSFPESEHDDIVDAMSGGSTLLTMPTGSFDSTSIQAMQAVAPTPETYGEVTLPDMEYPDLQIEM